ncbi:hypothetical protein AMS68_006702 [Peltaster fructicola]|uniref:Uncharacterized protein n=1 Tax=Peltaster fructicola TaxID=286661 RepID=A0A6H0Y2N6_9PEZI|nr:hypothetical protein AMS68_006702 [Peltaster fructicola]
MTSDIQRNRDPWVTRAYPHLLGPHVPLARVTTKDRVHIELANVLKHGFKPRMTVDDLTPGDSYSALHASFKTALAATDSRSFNDYVRLRLSEAPQHGIDNEIPSPFSPEIELDRLVAMQDPDGEFLFPNCQLGVLTWEEIFGVGQGYATIYERESADWTIWILSYVHENQHCLQHNTWLSFGEDGDATPSATTDQQVAQRNVYCPLQPLRCA